MILKASNGAFFSALFSQNNLQLLTAPITMKQVLLILVVVCCVACSSSKKPTILPRSSWNAREAKPYKNHVPLRITIHHEGTKLEMGDDAARKINAIQRWGMGPDKKWADIPYHFLIAPSGVIYEGRNPATVGETSTEYDPSGHLLICCLGNLEVQPLPEQQLKSLISLSAFVAGKYRISPDSIASHRDYSNQTTCPGKNLYQHFESGYIKAAVEKNLRK